MIDERQFRELAAALRLATAPLSITGVLGAGNVLTASFLPGYSSAGLQWTSTIDGITSDIAGQTASTYTQLSSDRGAIIGCRAIGLAFAAKAGSVPASVPAEPAIVSVSAGDGSISCVFAAPGDNGGTAITGYRLFVYAAADNSLLATQDGASSPISCSSLVNGIPIFVKVAAFNSAGLGGQSLSSQVVIPLAADMFSRVVNGFAVNSSI